MNAIWAVFAVLIAYAGYQLAQDYVRRSMRSFGSAEQVWPSLVEAGETLLDKNLPAPIARFVVGLISVAGCGCFVRAMIMSHYLPRLPVRDGEPHGDQVFNGIDGLDAETRKLFWDLLAKVIIYDSYRNPLQGWLFRRAITEISRPNPSYQTRLEAQAAAFSVVTKRPNSFLPV